jgi:hypothetical protein
MLPMANIIRAVNNKRLEAIFAEIDKLEKSKIEITEFKRVQGRVFTACIVMACFLLTLEIVLRYAWLRSIALTIDIMFRLENPHMVYFFARDSGVDFYCIICLKTMEEDSAGAIWGYLFRHGGSMLMCPCLRPGMKFFLV